MAANFPTDREDLNPALPAGALQNGDTTTIGGITYTFNTPGDYWTAVGGDGDEYELPVATDVILGGIKVGSRLSITVDGELSADIQGGGGATVGSLQEVTDVGNTTDNSIVVGAAGYGTASDGTTILPGYLRLTGASGTPLNIYKTDDADPVIKFGVDGSASFAVDTCTINSAGGVTSRGFAVQQNDGTTTAQIFLDGKADFKNQLRVVPDDGDAVVHLLARGSNELDAKLFFLTKNAGGGTTGSLIYHDGGDTRLYFNGNTTASTKHMALDTDGNFAIGGTLPTSPNISLNANGDGVFGSRVQLGANWSDNDVAGIRLALGSDSGTVLVKGKTGINEAFSVRAGGSSPAATTARINMDGSASFAGNVEVSNDINVVNGNIVIEKADEIRGYLTTGEPNDFGLANAYGMVLESAPGAAGIRLAVNTTGMPIIGGTEEQNIYFGYNTSVNGNYHPHSTFRILPISSEFIIGHYNFGNSFRQTINFDGAVGSAIFSEQVKSGEPEATKWRTDANWGFTAAFENNGNGFASYWNNTHTVPTAPYLLRGVVNGTDTVQIKSDGSAQFKGDGNTTNNSLGINSLGLLSIRKDTSTDTAINVYSNGQTASDITFKVQADGSADFAAGEVTLNKVTNGAAFNVRRDSAQQAIGVYSADFTSGSRVISLNGDGSATFASTVAITPESTASGQAFTVTSGGTRVADISSNGSLSAATGAFTVATDGTIAAPNAFFNLEPDNPANFNAEGEYTGPTLDIKDRLNKANSALTAIKTAATDANTDLAGLKAAIVAALTDF